MKIIGWIRQSDKAACGGLVAEGDPFGDHIDLWNGSSLTATGMTFFSTLGRRLGVGSLGAGTAWGYSDLGRSSEILFWEIQ